MEQKTTITIVIPNELVELISKYKDKTGISKSRICTDAIKEYLKGKM